MISTRRLHLKNAVGQLGKQLSELGKTPLSKFLYGDGPSLADRLVASVDHSKTTHYEIINKACGDGPSLADRLVASVDHSKTTHYEIINKACGDGPSLADRLVASVGHSKTTHYEIINKACEALTHV